MIAELYANMCGAELWNRARLAAYMRNGITPGGTALRCAPCDALVDLIPCLDDAPPDESGAYPGYNLPELDPAPWYDPVAPESADFAGFLVTSTRLSPAVDRRMVQNVGHGGTLTRARFAGRTLEVRGWLVGRTCCATDYGLRWLTQALLGDGCSSCDGCQLTFLTCAPSDVDEAECLTVYEEDGSRVPYFREESGSEWERGTDFVRQMYGAGLLQGPEILRQRGKGCSGCSCAAMTEVEFTVGIGNPWLYRMEELIFQDAFLGGCDTETCRINFNTDDNCDPVDPCVRTSGCDEDPDCDEAPVPPPQGRLPLQQCGCVPFVTGRNCFSVPADREWFDEALVVEVEAGSAPLRNLLIHVWQNPLGLDCCAPENELYFADCNACATLLVGFVPAYGVLRFDSVTREVTVTCNNVTKSAAKNIGTLVGLPFDWLEVGCQEVCLGVDIDCGNTAEDATVSAWRVGREL